MPRRVRKSRRSAKPVRRAKRTTRRSRFTVPALKTTICPDRLIVALPYCDTFARTAAGGQEDFIFNLNSLFDPDRTGTGHQPMGFDQWNVFYNRYRVISVNADVWIKNNSVSALQVGVLGNNSLTTILGYGALEQSHCKTMMIGGSGGKDTFRIRRSFYLPRITGRTASQYMADDKYEALYTSNPSEVICMHITTFSPDATALDYDMTVKLIFKVELFDRHPLNISS